ncbi:g7853 [Coccomyxa viridis]|uniref:G7853 protein n=1 Tax=Coccomyxa viridis TaxID=1274662 RepID=A0ABP1G2Y4_9CHLO
MASGVWEPFDDASTTATPATATPAVDPTITAALAAPAVPTTAVTSSSTSPTDPTAMVSTTVASPVLVGTLSTSMAPITGMGSQSTVPMAAQVPVTATATISPPPIAGAPAITTSTVVLAPQAPGTPPMLPQGAAQTISTALSPPAEIPPWADSGIGNWQLIQFGATTLPQDVTDLPTNPGTSGIYTVRVLNPQHYYYVCTTADLAAVGITDQSVISPGHAPTEFPLGYGGATCKNGSTAQTTSSPMPTGALTPMTTAQAPSSSQPLLAMPAMTTGAQSAMPQQDPTLPVSQNPTSVSLPYADCPIGSRSTAQYGPLFEQLHSIQHQLMDDSFRLKHVADRLDRLGRDQSYPQPLVEANAA